MGFHSSSILMLTLSMWLSPIAHLGCQSAIAVSSELALNESKKNGKDKSKSIHANEPKLGHYVNVKEKSHIKFYSTAKMLGISSEVTGQFNDVSITATKMADLEKSTVEVTIIAKSIDTDNARRDRHLRKADFFDVEKFKTIAFKSKKVKKLEGNKYEISGNLTIKDKVTDIAFQILAEPVDDAHNQWRVKGEASFNRQKLGITYSSPFFLPDVGDEVRVSFDVTLRLK